jgi:hypothetical protein
MEWHAWSVDGKLFKIWAAIAAELRVKIREKAALEERIL